MKKKTQTPMPAPPGLPAVGDITTLKHDGPCEVVSYVEMPDFVRVYFREVGSKQKWTVTMTVEQYFRHFRP